jgi:RimJ/RimL family protein N-acetyltransferase
VALDGPILETARLVLRPPRASDFDDWARFHADPAVMATLGGVQARSVAWRGFTSAAGGWALQGYSLFQVIERASGRWIGRVGPHLPEGWPGTEVGWGLVKDAWGQGYAVEAAAASMDWAVATLGWTEIIHCIESTNANSQAVARKLGSRPLRLARLPAPIDIEVEIWGQSAEQWRARRIGAPQAAG